MTKPAITTRRLLAVGSVAAVAAATVNAAVYGLARAADVSFVVSGAKPGQDQVLLQHVLSLSLFSFAAGIAASLIVARLRRPSLRALQVLGAVLAVLSTAMDLQIESAVGAVTLASMHLVVGAAYVASLRRVQQTTVPVTAPVIEERVLLSSAA